MLNRIFSFASSAKETLIQEVTIKANILTLYSGLKHCYYSTGNNFGIFFDRIRQPNAKCNNEKFKNLEQHQLAHNITNPHIDAIETESDHTHFMACDLITPDDLQFILGKIKEIQNDKAGRRAHAERMTRENEFILKLGEKLLGMKKPKLVSDSGQSKDYDVTTDYLPDEDFTNLYNKFEAYFKENEQQLREQYQQIQNDLTWKDEALEVLGNGLQSFGYGALYAFLIENLVAGGISKDKAEWFVHATSLTTLAITSPTWWPVIVATSLTATIQLLKAQDTDAVMRNIIVSGIARLVAYYPLTVYGCLNFAVSTLGSCVGCLASQSLTQSFWNYIKPNGNAQAPSPAQSMPASTPTLKKAA